MSINSSEDDLRYGRPSVERYFGKYAGIVADNGPPPAGAHRGEVVVAVPGILEETPDGAGNQPIKVLASPAFLPGFFFVPEKDDRVWIEFVNGDINHPIWTGVWYPQDKPPHTADDAAPTLDQKIIRTKAGFVVQFDDTSGGEKLVIKDGTNKTSITLDKGGVTITADNGITLTCGGNSLTVAKDQIKLSGSGATLTISSTVDVS